MSKIANRIMPVTKRDSVENSPDIALIDLEKVAELMNKEEPAKEPIEKEGCGDNCSPDKKLVKKPIPVIGKKNKEVPKKDDEEKQVSSSSRIKMPSAKYLYDAAKRNDEKAYKEALAARSAVRAQMLKIAESLPDDEEEYEVAKTVEEREKIIKAVEAMENKKQVVSSVKTKNTEKKVVDMNKKTTFSNVKKDENVFVKASEVDELSKVVLAERLKKAGIEENIVNNYIKYAIASKVQDVPEFVKELASMSAGKNEKTALLKSWLVKEAKLSKEDKSRVYDYWTKELGYQDKEWCSDIVEDVDPVKGAK